MSEHSTSEHSKNDHPPASRVMPAWLLRWLEQRSDSANPLLVRIVRQNLRNRVFLGVFFLLLAAGATVSFILASTPDAGNSNSDSGEALFQIILGLWGFGAIIVQSMMLFRSVMNERQDATWDLIELTTLEPRHILRGLLLNALTQLIMYSAALAPYLMMAYMLRGTDIRLVLLSFIAIPALSLSANVFAIFCACLTNKKSTQLLFGLCALAGAILLYIWCISLIIGSSFILGFSGTSVSWWDICGVGLAAVNIVFMFNITLLIFSASLLKHRAANRSTAPRAIWMLLYANIIIFVVLVSYVSEGRIDSEAFGVLGCIGAYMSLLLGAFAVSEHFHISQRQNRDLQRPVRGLFSRLRQYSMIILGPGSARGRLAYIGMALLSVGIAVIPLLFDDGSNEWRSRINVEYFMHSYAVTAYGAISLVICDALTRYWRCRAFLTTPALRRSFSLTVFAIYNLVVGIVLSMTNVYDLDKSLVVLIHPFFGIASICEHPADSTTQQIILVCAGALALLYILFTACTRLQTQFLRTVASDNDHNPRGA